MKSWDNFKVMLMQLLKYIFLSALLIHLLLDNIFETITF
jgi:hypothetical protein